MSEKQPSLVIIVLLIVLLAAFGGWFFSDSQNKVSETAASVSSSASRQLFDSEIVALLDRRCSNCHGVSTDDYAALEEDPDSRLLLRWPVDASGRIASPALADIAWERARTTRKHGKKKLVPIDSSNPALASGLLLAPLSETYAGTSFAHPVTFASPADPDFVTLQRWVQAEIDEHPKQAAVLSSAPEQFFAAEVTPILDRKGCFGSNCHGLGAFNDLKLHPGVPIFPQRFTTAMHQQNRLAMLGWSSSQIRMVQLSGDIEQSRQLLKNIPLAQGGILHKGGNNFFEKADPDYAVLLKWLELEKQEASQRTNAELGEERGIIFVRRPRDLPQRYFEDGDFTPGGDLIWLYEAKEINLTAALHNDSPADIRTPDVSYDARKVVFSMRRNPEEPLNIWELELDTGAARQLTFSTDPAVHFQDPQYVPDHDDASGEQLDRVALVMVSNLAGEWAASSPAGILGEAEGGDRQSIIDNELTARAGSYDGKVIRIVRGTNVGESRKISRQVQGKISVDKPFTLPSDATTHYVIDVPQRYAPSYDLYRMTLATPGQEPDAYANTLSRLTYGLGQIRRPAMRTSGEVMFTTLRTGWQSDRPYYNAAVFRTFYNGGNYHTHYGNRSVVPILADNYELPNGLEIRVGRDADSYWGGALLVADHQFGTTIDPANPVDDLNHPFANGMPDHAMHQFFRGWVSLDADVSMSGVSTGGVYRDPRPAPDGSILVAYAPGPVDLADPGQAPDFDIIRVTAAPSLQSADGLSGGSLKREHIVGDKRSSELWPRPVVVRAKERLKKSPVWATELFGEPGREKGLPGYAAETPAHLVVFDLILLHTFFEQSVPAGERHLMSAGCKDCGNAGENEQVSYARVIGAQPLAEGEAGPPKRYIIAELPLETDGSFQVVIPSLVNFDIQSLNAERMALRSPNRWLYALPGEKHTLSIPRMLYTQTCAGCHGALSGKRSNSFGRPDAITSASRTLAVWDDKAHKTLLPANYDVAAKRYRTEAFSVGFEEDIKPVLAERCGSCHSGAQAKAGLDLNSADVFSTLREQVDHTQALAINSPLVETLLGRELLAPRPLGSAAGLHKDLLQPEELLQVIRWVDLGAPRARVALQ